MTTPKLESKDARFKYVDPSFRYVLVDPKREKKGEFAYFGGYTYSARSRRTEKVWVANGGNALRYSPHELDVLAKSKPKFFATVYVVRYHTEGF